MNGGGGRLSDLYAWEDVTQAFAEACKDLKLGELLHDESFGLFEVTTGKMRLLIFLYPTLFHHSLSSYYVRYISCTALWDESSGILL